MCFRYLIEQGADIAAVNNDGELAVDIAESDEMEDLLHAVLKDKGIVFASNSNRTNCRVEAGFAEVLIIRENRFISILYENFRTLRARR